MVAKADAVGAEALKASEILAAIEHTVFGIWIFRRVVNRFAEKKFRRAEDFSLSETALSRIVTSAL